MTIIITTEFLIAFIAVLVALFFYLRYEKTKDSNETEFLEELTRRYKYWLDREPEYAEAYKVLMNKFTSLEEANTEE